MRELLNHTSGIPDCFRDPRVSSAITRNPRLFIPVRTLIARAVSHPLDFEPGHDFGHSDTNDLLLGLVVEKATGSSLERASSARCSAAGCFARRSRGQ